MFKKIIFGLVLFFIGLCAIVFVVVRHALNADSIQQQMVEAVEQVTGREMKVEGKPKVRWLPEPVLTLKDVTISNFRGFKNPYLMKIPEIRVSIGWSGLFENPARIKKISLKSPELFIEQTKNDTNLRFNKLFKEVIGATEHSLLEGYQQPTQVETVDISDGTVHYVNLTLGVNETINTIHGRIDLTSLNGPLKFVGRGVYENAPLNMDLNIGELLVSHPIDFKGRIEEPTSKSVIDFFGQIFQENPKKYIELNGNLNVEQPNTLFPMLKQAVIPTQYDRGLKGNFKIEIGPTSVTVHNANVRLGDDKNGIGINANGIYEMVQKKIEGNLAVTVIDLDIWQSFVHPDTLKGKLSRISEINGELNIEKIIVKNNRIENVHMEGIYQNKELNIKELHALLPGGTSSQWQAVLRFEPEVQFNTVVDLQMGNTRDLLNFLGADVSWIQDLTLLRQGTARVSVKGSPEAFVLSVPQLSLDKVSSTIVFTHKTEGDKLEVLAKNLNVDLYTSRRLPEKAEPLSGEMKELFEFLKNLHLPSRPLTVTVYINDGIWHNVPISSTLVTGEINNREIKGKIKLSDMVSANITTDFSFKDVGSDKVSLASSSTTLSTSQLDVFLRRTGWTLQSDFLDNTKQFSMDMNVSGTPEDWFLEGKMKRQNMKAELKGHVVPTGLKNMNLSMQHPDFRTFVRSLDHSFSIFPRLNGELSFVGTITGNKDEFEVVDMDMSIGDQNVKGNCMYRPTTHMVGAELTTDAVNLSKFLLDRPYLYTQEKGFSSQKFNFTDLNDWTLDISLKAKQLYYNSIDLRDFQGAVVINDKKLMLKRLSATWPDSKDSRIQVSGQVSWQQGLPQANMNLQLYKIPARYKAWMIDTVGLEKGLIGLTAIVKGSGNSLLEIMQDLSGQGSILLSDGDWYGFDTEKVLNIIENAKDMQESSRNFEPVLYKALTSGKTKLDTATANFSVEKGNLKISKGEAKLLKASAADIQAVYNIPTRKIKAQWVLNLSENLPPIIYTLDNQKRLNYYVDVKPLLTAVDREIASLKKEGVVKKQKEKQDQIARQLQKEKERISSEIDKVMARIENIQVHSPEKLAAGSEAKMQTIATNMAEIKRMIEGDLKTWDVYSRAQEKISEANSILSSIEQGLVTQNISKYQAQTESFLSRIDEMLLEMMNFYNNKKQLSILGTLIKKSQEQKQIIYRASNELRKPLTAEQAQKVYSIIESAFAKVQQAHEYSYKVYTNQENAPMSGAISVGIQ